MCVALTARFFSGPSFRGLLCFFGLHVPPRCWCCEWHSSEITYVGSTLSAGPLFQSTALYGNALGFWPGPGLIENLLYAGTQPARRKESAATRGTIFNNTKIRGSFSRSSSTGASLARELNALGQVEHSRVRQGRSLLCIGPENTLAEGESLRGSKGAAYLSSAAV